MKKISALFLILSISLFAKIDTEIFARWMINKGDLLVEKGNYLEAVDTYSTALESTKNRNIKLDAMLHLANVYLYYLNQKKDADKYLSAIFTKYPKSKQSEYALYFDAMIKKELNPKLSIKLFKEYLQRYPNGKYSFQAKYFLRNLKINNIHKKESSVKNNYFLKKIPIVRVLLKKNAKRVKLKGELEVNGKKYRVLNIFYKDRDIVLDTNKYKELLIKAKSPIFIKEKNHSYLGDILLKVGKRGIDIINLIDMKRYIYGVVTSESYNSWHIEALKAQAVASRTYTYYQTLVRKNWSYDVRDNTFDQAYKGFDGITKKSKLATDLTSGEILFYKNRPILAQYTANSGWYSSSSKEIFDTNLPYLYAHRDNFSVKMPDGRWVKRISTKKLENNLRRLGIKVRGIKDIIPYRVTKSGRVVKVKIIAKNGETVLRAYNSIRRAANLKDILMDIEKKSDIFYFRGGGYGHGVGYSQWGAEAMAKQGYNYKKILQFYYKDCSIKKLWR